MYREVGTVVLTEYNGDAVRGHESHCIEHGDAVVALEPPVKTDEAIYIQIQDVQRFQDTLLQPTEGTVTALPSVGVYYPTKHATTAPNCPICGTDEAGNQCREIRQEASLRERDTVYRSEIRHTVHEDCVDELCASLSRVWYNAATLLLPDAL